jgi:hypothetical protein
MRHAAQPFAKEGVNLLGVERVGNPLHPARRTGGPDAVVQRLERNVPLRQLPFQPLVPIETELCRIG